MSTVELNKETVYWFVNGRSEKLDDMLKEGYWDLPEKYWGDNWYVKALHEMKIGDEIALKVGSGNTSTPGGKLYNDKGTKITWMKIVSIGTITETMIDEKRVNVRWNRRFNEEKIWYYFNYIKYIWKVIPQNEEWKQKLVGFAFNDESQDLDWWRNIWLGFDKAKEAKNEFGPTLESKYTDDDIDLREIERILTYKKQVILYGPPGTGKTFKANEFVEKKAHIAKADQEQFVKRCTFHPEYGYEHFIEGLRPKEVQGNIVFERRDGIFKDLCQRAQIAWDANQDENESPKFYLIIDEINRGDIPRIFGELITLIENDKRDSSKSTILPLSGFSDDEDAQKGKSFWIPPNVYIIATMNTADRSIALLDTALRRRFGFYEMKPDSAAFKTVGLEYSVKGQPLNKWFDDLNINLQSALKERHDVEHVLIGHSFFLQLNDLAPEKRDVRFEQIIRYEILPLLQEYCYEDKEAFERMNGFLKETTGFFDETKGVRYIKPGSNQSEQIRNETENSKP